MKKQKSKKEDKLLWGKKLFFQKRPMKRKGNPLGKGKYLFEETKRKKAFWGKGRSFLSKRTTNIVKK